MKGAEVRLRELAPKGMEKLERDLETLRREDKADPFIDINSYESKEIEHITVKKDKSFESKFSAGKYFLHVFPEDFKPSAGVWSWLSVFYFRQLLNKNRKIGELQRLFISESRARSYPYRHLLKAPYDICRFYKASYKASEGLKLIEFILLDRANANGEFYRRIAENQDIIRNPGFIETAQSFFYDERKKSLKKNLPLGDSIQRLIKVWKQYERSFDMYRMPSGAAIKKLLAEHEEFQKLMQK